MNNSTDKLWHRIYKQLRDKILSLELPPDTSLSEKELCKEFNVSRSPIREAIRKLEDLGLVKALPGYGTRVTPINIDDVGWTIEIKKNLESMAGTLAAQRISDEEIEELGRLVEQAVAMPDGCAYSELGQIEEKFQQIIYKGARNPILHSTLNEMNIRCGRLFVRPEVRKVIEVSEVLEHMKIIFAAIQKRDSYQVSQALEKHVDYFIAVMKDTLFFNH
jgi:DNA-binding GntR family transcriptional regulator